MCHAHRGFELRTADQGLEPRQEGNADTRRLGGDFAAGEGQIENLNFRRAEKWFDRLTTNGAMVST